MSYPSGVTDARPPFRFSAQTRVGFDETDAQGVVYYGRYLPYFDRARVEYHRLLGLLHLHDGSDRDGEFVMRACDVSYRAPARFDDLLEVFVRAARLGSSSVTWKLEAYRADGTLLVEAIQTLVYVDLRERRATPFPGDYRKALATFDRRSLEVA